jgi:ankyrin repeat protein
MSSGYEKLQMYSEQNNYKGVQKLLRWGIPPSPTKTITDFSYFSALTDTPLHNAAKVGNYEMAKLLIDNGAVLDWCCCSCVTPLHLAIINKHTDIVKLLLSSGASTKMSYDLTYTVIELALLKSTPEILTLIKAHNKNEKGNTNLQAD